MASTRSRHIRKLKQSIKHFETAQIYLSEMGATYQDHVPNISEACLVSYRMITELKQHTQRIIESI